MFSVGYVVTDANGRRAFLKALNLGRALKRPDWLKFLQVMLETFNYESQLLEDCRDLDRVVSAIDKGEIEVDPASVIGRVPYLIFELGDGDVRQYVAISGKMDTAWALRCLHHIAVGTNQLHGGGIAHQDLKPSNVLTFGKKGSRIADLGSASRKGTVCPTDHFHTVGDPAHVPPEYPYNYAPPDWDARRFATDLYLLGSMVVFMFAQVSMTSLLFANIDAAHRPRAWRGDFAGVLPFLQDGFARALKAFKTAAPAEFADDLTAAVQQLCNPDPAGRGHSRNLLHRGDRYSLERFVSLFDRLATKAEKSIVGRRR